MRHPLFKFTLLFSLFFFIGLPICYSSPLTLEECLKTKAEHQALVDSGVAADIEKGYKKASSGLSKDRLLKIKRWFELQENILFRCPRIKTQKQDNPTLKEAAKTSSGNKSTPPSNASKTELKTAQPTSKKDS